MYKMFILMVMLGTLLLPGAVLATPSQFGETGLITVPTADTLESGNLAIGLWGNVSETGTEKATLLPVSLTMGLGSFIEAYGSFPNLLFNDDETASGRGFANLGLKVRALGRRSSSLKLSIDVAALRHISANPNLDGLTDVMSRAIVGFKTARLGLHLNTGYRFNDSKFGIDDQVVGGAGLELYPMARLRILAEFDMATEALSGLDQPMEALFGFQYFLSPHLTFHASYGTGLSDTVNDWRIITGFSTSQGIGTYIKPVPRIIETPEEETKAPVKKAKFKALTPLIPKKKKRPVDLVEKLEIPVEPGTEEVVVDPSERLVIPGTAEIKGPPVSPVSAPAPVLPVAPPPPAPAVEGIQVKPAPAVKGIQVTPAPAVKGIQVTPAPAFEGIQVTPAPAVKEIQVKPAPAFESTVPVETVVYRKFRFDELNYEFDQHTLSEAGARAVALVAEKLRKENKFFILRVNGHTDTTGSETYNEKLGYKRAVSVAERLVVNEGIDPSLVFVKGMGESDPIADNATPEGRSLNRRSEILVLLPKKK